MTAEEHGVAGREQRGEMGEYARILGFALCTASMTFAGFAAYAIFAAAAEAAQGVDPSGNVGAGMSRSCVSPPWPLVSSASG